MTSKLTQARLFEVLTYEPGTGLFKWNARKSFQRSGLPAGTLKNGYIKICIDQRPFYAHRLAWLYVMGVWPSMNIDHINGVKSDNRCVNLRNCTQRENTENLKGPKKSNTSGFLGVSRWKRGLWQAKIGSMGRTYWLGEFVTAEEAHQAYLTAKRQLHVGGTL